MRHACSIIALLACSVLLACGEDSERATAVEAQEGNEVLVGSFSYRVVLFRELNRNTVADRALIESVQTDGDHGLYGAFIEVCNRGDAPQAPAARITLEDALGEQWSPVSEGVDPALAYSPRRLDPGQCLPQGESAADRTFDGAALVFEIPYESTQDRPMILDIEPTEGGGEEARIVLDL